VAVNCSALPESLLESELFGHARGAFTGAFRDKRGRFEAASGGAIFLDEVGDISANIQIKLLRVLQERTIERVGDERPVAVDIRVIAATNRPLAELVSAGRFRQDLYYRLRVVPIQLPKLSKRRDDIPLVAQHFVERFRERTGRPIDGINEDALALMLDHPWPGNVRELENAIEYAFVKARQGLIVPAHLPPELLRREGAAAEPPVSGASTPSRARGRTDLSPERVRAVLAATGWNIAKAARRLSVSRTTLYKRMSEFDIHEPGK
jgi:transcriptional regulator with GAF, ATPase, and Fis domain